MAAYTGTILVSSNFGTDDQAFPVLGKASWTATSTATDTFTYSLILPKGLTLKVVDFEVYGTQPDSNATPTTSVMAGVNGDTDAFLAATVSKQVNQFHFKGTGASIGTTLSGATNIVVTFGGTMATGVATGDVFVKLIAKRVAA
jgi:hypothetical protein